MKTKVHYVVKNKVSCGKKNVFMTSNYNEITCKRCIKTVGYKIVKTASKI